MAADMQTASTERAPRVAVLVSGSRGDVQPAIALGLALTSRGCDVKVLCNINHVAFVQSFGLDVSGFPPDIDKFMQENEVVKELMTFGKLKNGGGLECVVEPRESRLGRLRAVHQICMAFRPDVILYNLLLIMEATLMEQLLGICTLQLQYQPLCPTKHFPPPGLPKLPLSRNMIWWSLVDRHFWKKLRKDGGDLAKEAIGANPLKNFTLAEYRYRGAKYRPCFCAVSPLLLPKAPCDWPAPAEDSGFHLTGFLALSPDQQLLQCRAGNSAFGSEAEMQAIEAFIAAAEEPPVYIGWGSMTVGTPEFMAQLAVRSLRGASKRGIIVGGWAKLGPQHLAGAEDAAHLESYAKEHVLWLSSAPHEVLFPRCSTIVHHGGAGTTAASLRAGRPTVVTPVWLDQFLFAYLIQEIGAGVGTPQLGEVSADLLSTALLACDSPEVVRWAAELGALIRAEDGAGKTADAVIHYVREHVRSGRWKMANMRRSGWCGCFRAAPVRDRLGSGSVEQKESDSLNDDTRRALGVRVSVLDAGV